MNAKKNKNSKAEKHPLRVLHSILINVFNLCSTIEKIPMPREKEFKCSIILFFLIQSNYLFAFLCIVSLITGQ